MPGSSFLKTAAGQIGHQTRLDISGLREHSGYQPAHDTEAAVVGYIA